MKETNKLHICKGHFKDLSTEEFQRGQNSLGFLIVKETSKCQWCTVERIENFQ